jgi:hypothetical protein
MFHVPRTVGLGCHTGSAVLFSPWRIAFRVDAIYTCISSEARRLVFCWEVVRASGHSPSHSEIRLSLFQQHVPFVALLHCGWRSIFGTAAPSRLFL